MKKLLNYFSNLLIFYDFLRIYNFFIIFKIYFLNSKINYYLLCLPTIGRVSIFYMDFKKVYEKVDFGLHK